MNVVSFGLVANPILQRDHPVDAAEVFPGVLGRKTCGLENPIYFRGLTLADFKEQAATWGDEPRCLVGDRAIGRKPVGPAIERQLWLEAADFRHKARDGVRRNVGWVADQQIERPGDLVAPSRLSPIAQQE